MHEINKICSGKRSVRFARLGKRSEASPGLTAEMMKTQRRQRGHQKQLLQDEELLAVIFAWIVIAFYLRRTPTPPLTPKLNRQSLPAFFASRSWPCKQSIRAVLWLHVTLCAVTPLDYRGSKTEKWYSFHKAISVKMGDVLWVALTSKCGARKSQS